MGFAGAKRRKIQQLELAFMADEAGEARREPSQGSEAFAASHGSGGPEVTWELMAEICDARNMSRAMRKVMANKGGPGVDGLRVDQLPDYYRRHGPTLRAQLLAGTYRPQPVKRVLIPKATGGQRQLGVPTVMDRMIQQAVLQVLQPDWDATFSGHSYGFRPGRSAHQAIARAQQHAAAGYHWVVDIDLAQFFDRVNHDRLMASLARRVEDKRVLKLIRRYLQAGVLDGGLTSMRVEGTPQGGPLSPLLSNIVLDELDQELTRRGHRFVRYADDCNIYVRSKRAGQRVMQSITRFITERLKLQVNVSKSAVDRLDRRSFLGFSFTHPNRPPRRRLSPRTTERFKSRIRELTRGRRRVRFADLMAELRQYMKGWLGYFGFCQTPSVLHRLHAWICRRLRSWQWRQWKHPRRRGKALMRLGLPSDRARYLAKRPDGPWAMSRDRGIRKALSPWFFERHGLPYLSPALAS